MIGSHMRRLRQRLPWWWNRYVWRAAIVAARVSIAISLIAASRLAAAPIDGHVFLLKRQGDTFEMERVAIPDGETRVIQSSNESGVIDIIMPVGPGGSGSIAQTGSPRMLIARNVGGELRVTAQDASGQKHESPPRQMADLVRYDTRLSVIASDGARATFQVSKYTTVSRDSVGPVMDLFGGAVPLGDGDYSITTNTEAADAAHSWRGAMPLTYNDGYLFVPVTGPDGRTGTFCVDIGASKTIVCDSFLPNDAEITESYMMEYSSKGARKLKYEPGGATGPVRTVKGQTTLASLDIGGVRLTDVDVDVITSLPELRGHRIDGIIGMNVLRAGPYLKIEYGDKLNPTSSLSINDRSSVPSSADMGIPFARNGETIYVRGEVNSVPVYFILDSGAPSCVMPPQSLQLTGAHLSNDSIVTFRGGGGQEWQGRTGKVDGLRIGGHSFDAQPFMIGDIQVLQRLASGQASGLLGNSFFAQFNAMEIDFNTGVVRFAGRRDRN